MSARGLLLCAALVVAHVANAAVHVCVEGGTKVFRDRPCAEDDPPAPPPAGKLSDWDIPKPTATVINVYSQVVGFTLPPHWVPGHQSNKPLTYMAEFVPAGQTVQAWSEMITVQGLRGLASKITPRQFLEGLAARIAKACPRHYVGELLGEASIDAFPAHLAILGCARYLAPTSGAKPGQGEIAVFAAIQGTNEIYVVQRAIRGEAFDGRKPPINAENGPEMLSTLGIKICEYGEAGQCATRKPRSEPARTRPPSTRPPGRATQGAAAPPPG